MPNKFDPENYENNLVRIWDKGRIIHNVIEWNRNSIDIVVTDADIYYHRERMYECSWGACNVEVRENEDYPEILVSLIYATALRIIIRDKCCPLSVNNALNSLHEYRYRLPSDMFEYIPIKKSETSKVWGGKL